MADFRIGTLGVIVFTGFGLLSMTCLVLVVYMCVRGPRLRRLFSRSTRGRNDRDKVREKLKNKLLKRFKAYVNNKPQEKGFLETITLHSAYDVTCPICLDTFIGPPSQSPVCLLSKCGHFYHFRCVWTWLDKHSRCPVCRRNVPLNDVDIRLIPLEKILAQGTYLELEGGLKTVSMMKGPLQDGVKRIRLPKAKPRASSLFSRSRTSNMSTSRSELIANPDGFSPFSYDTAVEIAERVEDSDDSSDDGDLDAHQDQGTSSESVTSSSETESPSSYPTSTPTRDHVTPHSGVGVGEPWANLTPTRCPFEPFQFPMNSSSVQVTVERELDSSDSDQTLERPPVTTETATSCPQTATSPVTCYSEAPSTRNPLVCSVSVLVTNHASCTSQDVQQIVPVAEVSTSGQDSLPQASSNLTYLYDNLCSSEPSPEGAEVSWHL